jgi:hypothetical protein
LGVTLPAIASRPAEIVHVPFRGGEVLAVEVAGKPHILLRPALEALGVDYSTQLRKLKAKSWAVVGTSPTQDQYRDMATVDVRTFLMLLATIDERRVGEDVRPVLIAYQNEVADAIEAYWTKGIAVNPRPTYVEQAQVLATLRGVCDPGYLDTRGRQLAARALGEAPEYDPLTRPLTISIYLDEKGVPASVIRRIAGEFGKAVKASYRALYREDPPTVDDLVGRHMIPIAQYQERHRPLFDAAWPRFATKVAA